MMEKSKVYFGGLPQSLAKLIGEKNFLYGYQVCGENRFVVHHTNGEVRNGDEVEFDASEGRFLSNQERLCALNKYAGEIYRDENIYATASYEMRQPDSEAYIKILIFSINGTKIVGIDECLYQPFPIVLKELVYKALKNANLPHETRERRIEYFGRKIHNFRRSRGEIGADENDVFNNDLMVEFEKEDPNFLDILSDVLVYSAFLEMMDPNEFIKEFSKRVPAMKLLLAKTPVR